MIYDEDGKLQPDISQNTDVRPDVESLNRIHKLHEQRREQLEEIRRDLEEKIELKERGKRNATIEECAKEIERLAAMMAATHTPTRAIFTEDELRAVQASASVVRRLKGKV